MENHHHRLTKPPRAVFFLEISGMAIMMVLLTAAPRSAIAQCSDVERVALLELSSGITADPLAVLTQWSNSTPNCCNWTGVSCSPDGVQSLDLANSSLSGSIASTFPPSSGDLPFLTSFNLSSNNFSGSIPDSLSGIPTLNSLLLSHNSLYGIIPGSLVSLQNLTAFDVSSNQLAGEIPQAAPFTTFPASSYADNSGLCGTPLSACLGY